MRTRKTRTSRQRNLLSAGVRKDEGDRRVAGAGAGDLGSQLQASRCVASRVKTTKEKGAKEMKPAEVSTPSDREVLIKRSFDAPVNLVWQAYTEPALMRRWLTAMPGWSMPVCEMDTHVGGTYRWRWSDDANGIEFGFTGEMLEVDLHSKLVHTQVYDPGNMGGSMGDGASVITVTFNETDGITNVATLIKFASKADRDAAV